MVLAGEEWTDPNLQYLTPTPHPRLRGPDSMGEADSPEPWCQATPKHESQYAAGDCLLVGSSVWFSLTGI